MEELLISVIYALIIGVFAGYFIGYFVKRLSYMALPIGVFAFLLMYLIYTKSINLNLDELIATITKFANVLGPLGLATLATSAPFVGSFVVGLVLGFKRG